MNRNQPKYITYKGSRYQRVDSINEMEVRHIPPLPPCCIIYLEDGNYPDSTASIEFESGQPYKIIKDILDDAWDEENGERPDEFSTEPEEIDKYSYFASINEETGVIVCVRGRGAYGHIYDLAKTWVDLDKEIDKKYGPGFVLGGVVGRRNIDPDDVDTVDNAMFALVTALDNLFV